MSDVRVPHSWDGNEDATTLVGEGVRDALNVSFYYEGELRRRPGLGARYAVASAGGTLGAVEHVTAGSFLLSLSGGVLSGYKFSSAATVSLKSGLNTNTRGMFAYNNGAVYFTNDYDPVQVVRRGDVACDAAGIAGPAAAPVDTATAAGSVSIGSHLVRYRYKNSQTGYVSNASPALTYVAPGAATLPLTTVASVDTKVDQIVVEMTLAAGQVFYVAKVGANGTSITVDMSDATLAQQVGASATDGDQLGAGHEPPPISLMLIEHRARLFAWGASSVTVTCGVTNASKTVTGAGFSLGWAGRLIQVGTDTTTYTIDTVTATVITLVVAYGGGTNAAVSVQVFSGRPDLLYWSRAGYPESWKPLSWARRVFQGASDKPAAIASLYGDLYLIGLRGMRRLVYTDDPATGMLVTIPTELGAWNYRCVVNADGRLFGWGPSGAWEITGLQPKHISRDIDDTVKGLIDSTSTTYTDSYFGFYDPGEKVVWWIYKRLNDTAGAGYPRDALCYDLSSQKWGPRKFRNYLSGALTVADSTQSIATYIADGFGVYTWKLETGRLYDCTPSSLTTGVATVAAGSSTSVINIVETMPTGATDLIGTYVYFPATDEERRINANTANTITLSAVLSGAPAAGVVAYLGSIYCRLVSDWWPGGQDVSYRTRPAYFVAEQSNATATICSVRIFKDFSSTALTLTNFGTTFDPQPAGVTFTSGGTVMTGDLSSIGTYFPLPSDWTKVLRYELVQQIPFGTLALIDTRFEEKDPRNEDPKSVVP